MDLMDRDIEELKNLAKEYGIVLKGQPSKAKIVEELQYADIKKRQELEAKARAELAIEAGKTLDGMFPKDPAVPKPSPETVAIYGGKDPVTGKDVEPSPKKYYVFTNLEDPGVKAAARLGERFRVEMYDGKIHCLPEFAVRLWEQKCTTPVYAMRKNQITGLDESVWAGNRPRWSFRYCKDAPKGTKFGVTIETKLEAEFLQPVHV